LTREGYVEKEIKARTKAQARLTIGGSKGDTNRLGEKEETFVTVIRSIGSALQRERRGKKTGSRKQVAS